MSRTEERELADEMHAKDAEYIWQVLTRLSERENKPLPPEDKSVDRH